MKRPRRYDLLFMVKYQLRSTQRSSTRKGKHLPDLAVQDALQGVTAAQGPSGALSHTAAHQAAKEPERAQPAATTGRPTA